MKITISVRRYRTTPFDIAPRPPILVSKSDILDKQEYPVGTAKKYHIYRNISKKISLRISLSVS